MRNGRVPNIQGVIICVNTTARRGLHRISGNLAVADRHGCFVAVDAPTVVHRFIVQYLADPFFSLDLQYAILAVEYPTTAAPGPVVLDDGGIRKQQSSRVVDSAAQPRPVVFNSDSEKLRFPEIADAGPLSRIRFMTAECAVLNRHLAAVSDAATIAFDFIGFKTAIFNVSLSAVMDTAADARFVFFKFAFFHSQFALPTPYATSHVGPVFQKLTVCNVNRTLIVVDSSSICTITSEIFLEPAVIDVQDTLRTFYTPSILPASLGDDQVPQIDGKTRTDLKDPCRVVATDHDRPVGPSLDCQALDDGRQGAAQRDRSRQVIFKNDRVPPAPRRAVRRSRLVVMIRVDHGLPQGALAIRVLLVGQRRDGYGGGARGSAP